VKLENPPQYEPTRCTKCGQVIKLAEESHTLKGGSYFCERCTMAQLPRAHFKN
jgi:hypothetical protein